MNSNCGICVVLCRCNGVFCSLLWPMPMKHELSCSSLVSGEKNHLAQGVHKSKTHLTRAFEVSPNKKCSCQVSQGTCDWCKKCLWGGSQGEQSIEKSSKKPLRVGLSKVRIQNFITFKQLLSCIHVCHRMSLCQKRCNAFTSTNLLNSGMYVYEIYIYIQMLLKSNKWRGSIQIKSMSFLGASVQSIIQSQRHFPKKTSPTWPSVDSVDHIFPGDGTCDVVICRNTQEKIQDTVSQMLDVWNIDYVHLQSI